MGRREGLRKDGEAWVCPKGCFSRSGPFRCDHLAAHEKTARFVETLLRPKRDLMRDLTRILEAPR